MSTAKIAIILGTNERVCSCTDVVVCMMPMISPHDQADNQDRSGTYCRMDERVTQQFWMRRSIFICNSVAEGSATGGQARDWHSHRAHCPCGWKIANLFYNNHFGGSITFNLSPQPRMYGRPAGRPGNPAGGSHQIVHAVFPRHFFFSSGLTAHPVHTNPRGFSYPLPSGYSS